MPKRCLTGRVKRHDVYACKTKRNVNGISASLPRYGGHGGGVKRTRGRGAMGAHQYAGRSLTTVAPPQTGGARDGTLYPSRQRNGAESHVSSPWMGQTAMGRRQLTLEMLETAIWDLVGRNVWSWTGGRAPGLPGLPGIPGKSNTSFVFEVPGSNGVYAHGRCVAVELRLLKAMQKACELVRVFDLQWRVLGQF